MNRIKSLKSEGVGMTLSRKTLTTPVSMHLHDYYELEIVLSGTGEQILNGTGYPIGPGCVYFLTPIDFHAITPHGELHIAHLAFEEHMLSPQMRLLFMNRRENYIFPDNSKITQTLQILFDLLLQETKQEDAYSVPFRTDILELMLLTLSRAADNTPRTEVFTATQQMQRSLQYLFCHFREEITLGQVAGQSGYSPNYFSKLFHDHTGERFVDFLAKLRLNYARMLLRSTDLPISRIAEKSGFGSAASFHRHFQAACGCAPTRTRQKHEDIS